jgi:hypothetical protein
MDDDVKPVPLPDNYYTLFPVTVSFKGADGNLYYKYNETSSTYGFFTGA